MKKLMIMLLCMTTFGAYADDGATQVVKERMSCADMSAKMVELSAIEEPDDDTVIELQKLKSDYRRMCMKSAAGRKKSAKDRVVTEENVPDESGEYVVDTAVTEEVVPDEPVAQTEKTTEKKPANNNPMLATDAEVQMFHELLNLDMGLCADGTQPNKFGCCTDEIFKDLGNNVYACCPLTGGDCFPPLK